MLTRPSDVLESCLGVLAVFQNEGFMYRNIFLLTISELFIYNIFSLFLERRRMTTIKIILVDENSRVSRNLLRRRRYPVQYRVPAISG